MTTLKEAVAQALDALTKIHPANMSWETGDAWMNAVQILREALAQPETGPLTDEDVVDAVDPVEYHGWVLREVLFDQGEPVGHRAPPQPVAQPEREPLTDEEITKLTADTWGSDSIAPQSAPAFARAIERAHGIGGEE